MTGGRRDVEADLRAQLGRDARSWVMALRGGATPLWTRR
jgi:hypothetical protein